MTNHHDVGSSPSESDQSVWPNRAVAAAGTALVASWAFAFVAFFGTTATTHEPALRAVGALVFGVPVVVCALVAVAKLPHPLDLPLAGLLVTYTAICLLSVDRIASLETVPLVVAYASVFVLFSRPVPQVVQDGLALGTALAVTAWLVFFAVLWVGDVVTWSTATGAVRLEGRSGNLWLSTDAVAALVLVAAPHYLLVRRGSARRVVVSVSVVAAVVVIPLSGGRTAWIGMIVAAAIYALMPGGPWSARLAPLRRPVVLAGMAAGAVALVAVAIASSTLSGRTLVWATALDVIRAHPLTGSGPGTFSWVRLAEAPDGFYRYPVYHAHNVALQALSDGGIILLLAIVGFLFLSVRRLVRYRAVPDSARLAVASVAGFGVVLAMDELTQVPALASMAAASAGYGLRVAVSSTMSEVPVWRRATTASALVLVLALGIPAAVSAHAARTAAVLGRYHITDGDWSEGLDAFRAAAAAWPARAPYHLGLGLTNAELGQVSDARHHYELARTLSPGDPRPWAGLAALADPGPERVALLRRASQLGTSDPQFSLRLASELFAATEEDAAIRAWGRAAALDPQLLPPASAADTDIAERVALEALQLAATELGAIVDVAALESHVALELGHRRTGDPSLDALARAMDGDVEGAGRAIATVVERAPEDRRARQVALAINRALCREEDARRQSLALFLLGPEHLELYEPSGPPHPSFDIVYREAGLGDYQPSSVRDLPDKAAWADEALPAPDCPG